MNNSVVISLIRFKKRKCERHHGSSLDILSRKSPMGFKVPNASVLGGVKQHFQSFGLPFHHNPHEDHDKGGAAGLVGGLLKGMF